MTKDTVADVLRTLANDDKSRSETARLRSVVDEVEVALAAGVSRAAILQALNNQGFTMTPKSFESALYRIRKKRVQSAKPAAKFGHDQAKPAAQPAQAPQEEPAKDPQARIMDPADIRKSRRREINLDDLFDKE